MPHLTWALRHALTINLESMLSSYVNQVEICAWELNYEKSYTIGSPSPSKLMSPSDDDDNESVGQECHVIDIWLINSNNPHL